MSDKGKIIIDGAREHNLKDISIEIPKNKLIVITGVSGSGKSSLAFDTLYAEGQRRYIESLSAYARQFLDSMKKPDVNRIEGLSPAISIEQKTVSKNPRSTVGTVTEIYDYLRLLFARIGVPHSPETGLPIKSETREEMVARILKIPADTKIFLMAPIALGRKGEYKKEFADLKKQGYQRVKINGKIYDISEAPALNKMKKHDIAVVIDRLVIDASNEDMVSRLSQSLELSLNLGNGISIIETEHGEEIVLSSKCFCPVSGFSLQEIEPRLFSFNSPFGSCRECCGLGFEGGSYVSHMYDRYSIYKKYHDAEIIDDDDDDVIEQWSACTACDGYRLKPEALCVKICGKHIGEVAALSIDEAIEWINGVPNKISDNDMHIAERVLKEIDERLHFLKKVGLSYLTLSRSSGTLSGGEGQRIRLASQIGSGLTGVLYVLDEPSIGLHPRDNDRLIETLFHLRDKGNTVCVVEHDKDTIGRADFLIDMGPMAGVHGGHVVACGTPDEVMRSKDSLTAAYLRGDMKIESPKERCKGNGEHVRIVGAKANNLKNIDVKFPLGCFICVTGVSGGGKSSLIVNSLCAGLKATKNKRQFDHSHLYERIEGHENIDKIIEISQSPIGRTPHSTPATYTGVFTFIREWFSYLPESRARGYGPGRFSFNVKGGRCEACRGFGVNTISMHFLPDVEVQCDVCKGKRFSRDTLEIKHNGYSIADILEMPVDFALEEFKDIPSIATKLRTLCNVGMGYITIGQKATTLSGGEAQRVKLAKELSRRSTGKTFYFLDEPTTGLHFEDIRKLLLVLREFVNQGNTVLVIEHNLDVIKTADWVIDIGPESGGEGGRVVAEGTPEDIARCAESYTGMYLEGYL